MSTTIGERIRARAGSGPKRLRVCVLLGGNAAERPVSIASGLAVSEALLHRGHGVTVLDPATGTRFERAAEDRSEAESRLGLSTSGQGLVREEGVSAEEAIARTRRIVPSLAEIDPTEFDVVLSVLHGGVGEGGAVPAMLELLGLPYVGSDPISSAVTLDKEFTKRALHFAGVPVARDWPWNPQSNGGSARRCGEARPSEAWMKKVGGYPVVVKPLLEGSTVGLTIVKDPSEWETAWRNGAPYAHPTRGLLVEEYIPGREITVAVVAGEALPVVEIVPKSGFYDFEHKYTKGETEYHVPALLAEPTAARLQELALIAFRELGCRDLARIDFRLTGADEPYCLEINTLPGMTGTSLVPMASRTVGIEFDELLETLSRIAIARHGGGGGEGR